MRRIAIFVLSVLVSLMPVALYAAPNHGTEDEAVALVKKAIRYYDKVGRDKAMAEFSRSPGQFVDRDLYVTVFDMHSTALAHINPRMVGRDLSDIRDVDGKYILRERMEAARHATSGWQDYKFFNPVSKRVEPKHAYWEKHDNLVFACGAYKPN